MTAQTQDHKTPQPGDKAPLFDLVNANGEARPLSCYAGTWLVLYFYPKASTPGCTREAQGFTSLLPDFAACNATVVGVSPDSCKAITGFISKQQLGVELLSDPERSAAKAYGVYQLKKNYGKESMGIVRSTFIIDPKGVIRQVFSPVKKVDTHMQEALEAVRSLTAHV
ncbi:peroxiredoxin [Desulfovibrio mangrovi]|uniref:peroxiredoxin n=1 Tax=Desulfovibrio mangrovi TaxID=2976983 RepID=UPI0022458A4B|nr:peroxiredoxin [Desulfovibrio mangrovi]UZP65867.1 peroxiredoxin [Desulfovibrio mangrovi]